jgi:hypothetical protein
METVTELFSALWEVWKEMFKILKEWLPRAFFFILWIFCGIIILPCVFVAGSLYPKWTEWGEKL